MKRLVLYGFLMCLAGISNAQNQNNQGVAEELIKQAQEVMKETRAFEVARDIYLQALQIDPDNIVANYNVAEIYLNTIQKSKARTYLSKVYELNKDYKFNLDFLLGKACQYGMDFDNAIDYYDKYKSKLQNTKYKGADKTPLNEVERRIFECENGKKYLLTASDIEIKNLGSNVNSASEDYAPVVSPDENELVFTSRRKEGNLNKNVDIDNKPFEDIFISHRVDGKWQKAENIGNVINTPYHDSDIALSANSAVLFLYKDSNAGDIYVAQRRSAGGWTQPESFQEVNSKYPEKSITSSVDGKLMIFSSERPSGKGGLDLYYITKDGKGNWSKPRLMDEPVNTKLDEDSPFLDYDGKTLYFSSTGGEGMGGFDIYKSVYDSTSGKWSDPENLGFPINSPDNDVSFVKSKNGNRAYYSTVKDDGMGYTDIYVIKFSDENTAPHLLAQVYNTDKKEPGSSDLSQENVEGAQLVKPGPALVPDSAKTQKVENKTTVENVANGVSLRLSLFDAETGEPLDARITIQNESDAKFYPDRISSGQYEYQLKDYRGYTISVEKEGYGRKTLQIESQASGNAIRRGIALDKVVHSQTGSTALVPVTRVHNIYFDYNDIRLKNESFTQLLKLQQLLASHKDIMVEVDGHTDNVGTSRYNMRLSIRRAEQVKSYLVKNGCDSHRIIIKGFGETVPLASNDDEVAGRDINRRVEFKIIYTDSKGDN